MKKSFYLKYLEEQDYNQKQKLDENKKSSNFFIALIYGTKNLSRIIGYILLSILLSIGTTVLMNAEIRAIFLNLIKGGS
jgi:hypothetical protein